MPRHLHNVCTSVALSSQGVKRVKGFSSDSCLGFLAKRWPCALSSGVNVGQGGLRLCCTVEMMNVFPEQVFSFATLQLFPSP